MARGLIGILLLMLVLPTHAGIGKKIKFDYLFQTWMCSKDDDNIDGCEDNKPGGRKSAEITLTDLGDGRSVGTLDLVEDINGVAMKVHLRVFDYDVKNKEIDTTEFFVSLSDNYNSRATMGFHQVHGLENFKGLFGVYGHPFKKDGINIYPEFRLMDTNFKFEDAITKAKRQ